MDVDGRSQTTMLLLSGTIFFTGSAEYRAGSPEESLCSGRRKGRGERGLTAGGLAPRGASLSGEAVGSLELGTGQGHLKLDLVQTSTEEFGISPAKVSSLRDIAVERKELDRSLSSLVKVLTWPQTSSVILGNSVPLCEPHFHPRLENEGCG